MEMFPFQFSCQDANDGQTLFYLIYSDHHKIYVHSWASKCLSSITAPKSSCNKTGLIIILIILDTFLAKLCPK